MADTNPSQDFGDIKLGGKSFRIDFASWRGKDVIDFAPRASVPGGSFVMADLGLFQPLVQTDWRHGFGFHWYSDAMGYLSTTGNIDTRQDGLTMMFTKSTSSDTNNNTKSGIVLFNNIPYSYGAGGIRKYSGGAWTSIYSAAAVHFALPTTDYLFFSPDNVRIKKMNTSDTVTDAGLDGNATDYRWLIMHNGYIYAGKDASNAIHFDNSETLATLQGNSSDTNRILTGVGPTGTLGAIVYNGNLYVRKRDGIWMIGEDRIARRMLDFSAERSADNLRSWAVVNGFVIFPLRDRILQWNGARVSDITPKRITDSFPYTTYGRFDNFVAVGDYLYLTARTNESTYQEHLLCWDGVGWHKLMDLVTNGTDTVTMLAYEATNNYLWYHVDATADATYYIPFQNQSSFPYADFPTTGTHSLITSRLDAGFRRVKKSVSHLIVEARNVTATRYIRVYYALDGGSWVLWKDITTPGIIELANPGGALTREFNYIQFKFDFVTATAAQTPILEGYTMRFIMRPITRMGYNFVVIASSNNRHGMFEDSRTSQEIVDDLFDFRNSISPIELEDITGRSHTGYITALQEVPVARKVGQSGQDADVEYRYSVNFVEVFDAPRAGV
jgi:hypothetical protein